MWWQSGATRTRYSGEGGRNRGRNRKSRMRGIVSGLFGVGGALIVPPALTAFFGVRQVEGQGLGLALVAPGSVIALVAYAGAGQVDWRLGIPLAAGGVVAISAGVAFAHSVPERRLRFAFCGLRVLIAALLALHG